MVTELTMYWADGWVLENSPIHHHHCEPLFRERKDHVQSTLHLVGIRQTPWDTPLQRRRGRLGFRTVALPKYDAMGCGKGDRYCWMVAGMRLNVLILLSGDNPSCRTMPNSIRHLLVSPSMSFHLRPHLCLASGCSRVRNKLRLTAELV